MRIAPVIRGGLLALLLLAACSPAAPAPAVVVDAPKQLATVIITSTPVGTLVIPPTVTPSQTPTATLIPPTVTPTPTAYVGVFMGDGSAPLVLPTQPVAPLVEITLQPPTPLGGSGDVPAVPPGQPPAVAQGGAMTLPPMITLPGGTLVLGATPISTPPAAGGSIPCTGPDVDGVFSGVYALNPDLAGALGCPTGPAETLFMAQQPFEHGTMFWWSSGQIVALSTQPVNGVNSPYWQVADTWQEGMPADDPSMSPPPGLIQPIRGFGLAWRTNDAIRNALGWATAGEEGFTGAVQGFQGGTLFTTSLGVYALQSGGQYRGPLSG